MKSKEIVTIDSYQQVQKLHPDYEFRTTAGLLVDLKSFPIHEREGNYFLKNVPILIHKVNHIIPILLNDKVQHPNLLEYWMEMIELYAT